MDNDDKLDAVLSAADELQEFYDTHNNLQNNMPAANEESDDGGSAESTHGEPVQKALKTD